MLKIKSLAFLVELKNGYSSAARMSGEINYPFLLSVLNANLRGIKYFKGVHIASYNRKFCSGGPNNCFNKIEINYPGVQIFRYSYLDRRNHFSCDRTNPNQLENSCNIGGIYTLANELHVYSYN